MKNFPSIGRLSRASSFPKQIISLLEEIGGKFDPKDLPGPFCSELVAQILVTCGLIKPEKSEFAPSDFANRPDLFKDIGAVQKINGLDGINPSLSAGTYYEACKLISPPHQIWELSPQLMQTAIAVHSIVNSQALRDMLGMNEPIEDTDPEIKRKELFGGEIESAWTWARDVSDIFWQWYGTAQVCFQYCPANKLKSPQPPKANRRCESMFECSSRGIGFRSFSQLVEDKRDLLYKEIDENIAPNGA